MGLIRALLLLAVTAAPATADELVHFPQTISPTCRGGQAQLYDECRSQADVLARATAEAKRSGKVLLVVYGAEWCIWCHVFQAYVTGGHGRFKYQVEGEDISLFEGFTADRPGAEALKAYVAETFVIAHIEGQYSPDGDAVLDALGAWDAFQDWIPYIFAVRDGHFVAALPDQNALPGIAHRREGVFWYRGYNRETLQAELAKLAKAARQ